MAEDLSRNESELKSVVPKKSIKPEFTLIYDDLSWEAPDLRLVTPGVEHEWFSAEPDVRPYKHVLNGIEQRNIRHRFEEAVNAFVNLVSRMKVGEVYGPEFPLKPQAIPFSVKLIPLSKFISEHRHDDPREMHLVLPLNPIFVSLQFADVDEEKHEEPSMGLYASPATITLLKEWNRRIMGINSTFTSDARRMESIKTMSPIASLALIHHSTKLSVVKFTKLRLLAVSWLFVLTGRTVLRNDAFFTNFKDDRTEHNNLRAIGEITKESVKFSDKHRSNVTEANTLRQILTEGLASPPPSSSSSTFGRFLQILTGGLASPPPSSSSTFNQFLTKDLYDPRLWLHVWDMINHKDEED